MIGTDEWMRANVICPTLSAGCGKQVKCRGTSCAWFRFAMAPGVRGEHWNVETSKPVGYCAAAGTPDYQHLSVALGRHLTRVGKVLGSPRYDADRINSPAPAEAEMPEPQPMPGWDAEAVQFLRRHVEADATANQRCPPAPAEPADIF